MELTEIIDEVGRLQEEELQLGKKADQIRAENAKRSSEGYRQIEDLKKKVNDEANQYQQEADRAGFELRQVEIKKKNHFEQLCALYSNGQREEVKEAVIQIADKELFRKIEVEERRYYLNELLKDKSIHVKVSWGGGFSSVSTINHALDALVEGNNDRTILNIKRDAVKIPEITLSGEEVYLVSTNPLKVDFRYGYQVKSADLPPKYDQEIFRHDPYNYFPHDTLGELHLFSAPPVKNEQLEWLGLLVKQAVKYQENVEMIRAESFESRSDCDD